MYVTIICIVEVSTRYVDKRLSLGDMYLSKVSRAKAEKLSMLLYVCLSGWMMP